MPELPEVETVARGLRQHVTGATFGPLRLLDERSARTAEGAFTTLTGRTVAGVGRVGKFIRITLQPQAVLVAHLGMTGRLLVLPPDRPVASHTHLQIGLGPPVGAGAAEPRVRKPHSTLELRFVNPRWCMGGLWLVGGPDDPADPTAGLGPDPLAISCDDFGALLGSARRQIKALLLDQRAIAGIGNIYADESLFGAGIHPRARADRLSRPRRARLWAAMRDRLAESIRRGGSTLRDYRTVDGDIGWFQLALKVYGREGAPCPACGRPIRRTTIAGRSTHYCPKCQKF